jgi:O-antigen/teichoic acid export membrane protein
MLALMALLTRYASKEEMIAMSLMPLSVVMGQGMFWMIQVGLSFQPLFGFREVGYYNAASSLRNILGFLPLMLGQTTVSLMTNNRGEEFGGAGRVVMINTWITACFMIPVTALAMVAMPWILPLLFGSGFVEGVIPACYLLAVGLIHMVSGPAAMRLTILSPRAVLLINIAWVVTLLFAAWFLVPLQGATGATLALVISHLLTALLVPIVLESYGNAPAYLQLLNLFSMLAAVVPLLFLDIRQHTLFHWTNGMILLVSAVLLLCVLNFRNLLRSTGS